jgi:hypothetical protein
VASPGKTGAFPGLVGERNAVLVVFHWCNTA